MNKVQIRLSVAASILLLTACSDNNIFKFAPYEEHTNGAAVIEKIDFFLETSVSMKGYVNPRLAGDYPLKDIVPFLITDLDNRYAGITDLYTITNRPKKYTQSRDRFYRQLRQGTLLGGKSSKLQHVFGSIIDSIKPNTVSILVSDCILDLGKEDVMTQGSLVTTKIYGHLINQTNIGVAVFKFLSDFNGTYYYDRKNTGSNSLRRRPYYNTILKNRPFYVWVMGDKNAVKTLLSQNILEGYYSVHSYNLGMEDVPFSLLKEPKSGKIAVNPETNTVLIKEATERIPAQFTIGVNLKDTPSFFEPLLTNRNNYRIVPEYLEESILLEPESEGRPGKEEKRARLDTNYTHLLQTSLTDLDPNTNEIIIKLNNAPTLWFDSTNLLDDLRIPADSLEHKTFAFKFISNAFEKAFRQQKPLLEFKLIKQQQ